MRKFAPTRLAPECQLKLTAHPGNTPDRVDDIGRKPDAAARVRDRAKNRLFDPVRRIGAEAVASAPVELVGRADETDDALLDQVLHRKPAPLIFLRDGGNKANIAVDQRLLCHMIARLDASRENDLLAR